MISFSFSIRSSSSRWFGWRDFSMDRRILGTSRYCVLWSRLCWSRIAGRVYTLVLLLRMDREHHGQIWWTFRTRCFTDWKYQSTWCHYSNRWCINRINNKNESAAEQFKCFRQVSPPTIRIHYTDDFFLQCVHRVSLMSHWTYIILMYNNIDIFTLLNWSNSSVRCPFSMLLLVSSVKLIDQTRNLSNPSMP